MKALKEKRIGFRSLLRRGLVILSLFALIFAVACGGDNGGNTTPDPDPDPDPDPEVPAVTVDRFIITKHPTAVSFQGLPPDLTGLAGVIVYSDGTRGDIVVADMVSDPPFCDYVVLPSASADLIETWDHDNDVNTAAISRNKLTLQNGDYTVYLKDHPEAKAPVVLPMIVPFKSVAATPVSLGRVADPAGMTVSGDITGKWFSDEIPNFGGLSLIATYDNYVSDDEGTLVAAGTTKTIPVTGAYPPLIGIDAASLEASENPALTFGLGFDPTKGKAALDPLAYQYTFKEEHTEYVRSSGITANYGALTGIYYDDDADLVFPVGGDPAGEEVDAIMETLSDSGITLTVNYYGETETRTKTFADLMSSIDFYNSFLPADKQIGYIARTSQKNEDGSLITREDLETGLPNFPITLNYVPVVWGDPQLHGGASAWVDSFDVNLPVYTLIDAVASRKDNTGTNNVTVDAQENATPIQFGAAKADKGFNLLLSLQSKWELTGTYERGTVQETRGIPLTQQMFAQGINSTVTLPVTATTPTFILDESAQGYDWSIPTATPTPQADTGLIKGTTGANYPLPISYRGFVMTDPETTVVVDLIGVDS